MRTTAAVAVAAAVVVTAIAVPALTAAPSREGQAIPAWGRTLRAQVRTLRGQVAALRAKQDDLGGFLSCVHAVGTSRYGGYSYGSYDPHPLVAAIDVTAPGEAPQVWLLDWAVDGSNCLTPSRTLSGLPATER